MRKSWFLLALCLTAAGCVVGRASGSLYDIPRERATECQDICTKLDMQIAAVVVIMNTTGCVCEPRRGSAAPGTALTPPGTVGSNGGAAAAAAQVIARQLANQQARLGH
jgi:hypothetical protein